MAAQLTAQQKSIISAAKNGHSVFFTGYAGTGKSFVIKHLLKVLPENGLFPTLSTGISAVPLRGMTLLLRYWKLFYCRKCHYQSCLKQSECQREDHSVKNLNN